MSQLVAAWAIVFFAITMLLAARRDAATLTIGNRMVAGLLLAWIALAPLSGFSPAAIGVDGLAALAVLAATFGLFALRLIGGGDAKLLTAATLWVGAANVHVLLFWTTLVGAGIAIAMIGLRRAPLPARIEAAGWVERVRDPRAGIPYALAIAPAAIIALPGTRWFDIIGF